MNLLKHETVFVAAERGALPGLDKPRAAEIAPATAPAESFTFDFSTMGLSQGYCLVVVPTYNEVLNIERLVAEILGQGPQFDVLIVDDSSPDGTGDRVAAIAAQTARVQLLRRAGKLGLGTAYLAGFREGLRQRYGYICEMDADFSHQPRYLPVLLEAAEHDADVVLGSRNVRGGQVENWSLLRKLISRGGSFYARMLLGLPVRDCTGGFKCFRASALRRIELNAIRANGYAFQVEMNYRCYQAGLRMLEVPIIFPDRIAGRSKMSRLIVFEAALMVWALRFRPDRFASAPGTALPEAAERTPDAPALLELEVGDR